MDNMLVFAMSQSLIEEYRKLVRNAAVTRDINYVQSDAAATAATTIMLSSHLPASMASLDAGVPPPASNGKLPNEKKPPHRNRMQTEEIDAMILECARTLSAAPASSVIPAYQLPTPGPSSSRGSFLDALKSAKPSLLSRMHGRHEKENVVLGPAADLSLLPTPLSIPRAHTPVGTMVNRGGLDQHLTIASGPSFTLETRLVMTLCDELISYNLESLEDDPKAIMDLLKATASERDKWMIVGCHYRRKGNFKAAIVTVLTMIEGINLTYRSNVTSLT